MAVEAESRPRRGKGTAAEGARPEARGRTRGRRAEESRGETAPRSRIGHRPRFGRLTRRILAVNVLALVILVGGLLYLDEYRQSLIDAEIEALQTQGRIFAAALGQSAVDSGPAETQRLTPEVARQMVRRLVEPTRTRARLFTVDGDLIADSRILAGPGGVVQVETLPPPPQGGLVARVAGRIYDWVFNWLPRRRDLPSYREEKIQRVSDYREAIEALTGEVAHAVRIDSDKDLVISVAVPVQRYKQVLGALMLSTSGQEIEKALRSVRLDILKVFAVALALTVLLSLYLAGTIARPIRRLAAAAERVRRGQGRQYTIPDFTRRGDEIGDLSGALRDMTSALWQRMDAIERFAADVAHEIKNPLTSLRSAVETVARVSDPDQQRRLMTVILEDVQRLDRLISDISDASRLDAELSRAEMEPVDVGRLLTALIDVHRTTAAPGGPRFRLEVTDHGDLEVLGIDRRLVQVFRNLITNAISFSPPGGEIACRAMRDDASVRVVIDDHGPGIPEGKLDAIFQRFYSERPSGEKFGTHSGLGLSISRQIVEAHGGSIHAENRYEDGRVAGARFVVRLPRR